MTGRTSTMVLCAGTLLLFGCGGSAPEVKYASGFVPGRHRVAVLGVFNNGRMDEVAWTDLGPKLAPALETPCEPAFGERLRAANGALFDELDQKAQEEGITTELLDRLAAHTDAELILVIHEYGDAADVLHPPRSAPAPSRPASPAGAPPSGRHSHGGRRASAPPSSPPQEGERRPSREMAASLFAPAQHAFVAEIEVKASSKSAGEETAELARSLSTLISGSTCRPFGWSTEQEGHTSSAADRSP